MTQAQIAAVLKRIVGNQLADARLAIASGHKPIAIKELDDAVRVLKQLAAAVEKR